MKEATQPEEEANCHYSNGSITTCEVVTCDREHFTLEEAVHQLSVDATQGLYRRVAAS